MLLLVAVVAGWAGLRALWWTSPRFLMPPQAVAPAVKRVLPPLAPGLIAPAVPPDRVFPRQKVVTLLPTLSNQAGDEGSLTDPALLLAQEPVTPSSDAIPAAAAHQMLWMAAMASLPLPEGMTARPRNQTERGDGAVVVRGRRGAWRFNALAGGQRGAVGLLQPDGSRWSGDGWVLVRRDGDKAGVGSGFGPTYGGNQTGAVLRYRLGGDVHRLTAYVRAYGAMNGTGEKEAALGLSVRPLAGVPVAALAEVRASRFADGKTHARPAASLVSEVPPVALGKGVTLETYAQGGYVGGEGATGFVDGQMRVDRLVSRLAGGELRAGAGAWGGAQKGAARLDVGPTLRLGWSRGGAGARLSLDWRVRVEGHAAPSSGPALTLSAGF